MDSAIVKINPADYGLEESKAKLIEMAFKPMIDKMVELEKEFNQIIKLPIAIETCNQAHELRLQYVKVRTGTAAIHKKVKAYYRAGGLFVDGWKNAQIFASHGIELRLQAREDHYKNIEKTRIARLQEERSNALIPYDPGFTPETLGEMPNEIWSNYFNGVKLAYNERKKAEQKAKEERIAQEKAEKAERQRIREENERLKEEATERERVEAIDKRKREKADATRKRKMDRERKAFQAKLEKEENIRKEEAGIYQKKLQDEIAERERLEAETLKKEEAEQAIKDAEAAEIKKAELAPDVEKLKRFSRIIAEFELPECKSKAAKEIVIEADKQLILIAKYILAESNNIK